MAKAQSSFEVPAPPIIVLDLIKGTLQANNLKVVAQEGWTVTGKEGLIGPRLIGNPATVHATLGPTPLGTAVRLEGTAFGILLNQVHVETVLRNIQEGVAAASARMASSVVASPPVVLPDDPSLPPRVV